MIMIRVYMRSVIEKRGLLPSDASTLAESMEVLAPGLPVSLAAASLIRMARVQKYLDVAGKGDWTTLEELSQLIAETNEKLPRKRSRVIVSICFFSPVAIPYYLSKSLIFSTISRVFYSLMPINCDFYWAKRDFTN